MSIDTRTQFPKQWGNIQSQYYSSLHIPKHPNINELHTNIYIFKIYPISIRNTNITIEFNIISQKSSGAKDSVLVK